MTIKFEKRQEVLEYLKNEFDTQFEEHFKTHYGLAFDYDDADKDYLISFNAECCLDEIEESESISMYDYVFYDYNYKTTLKILIYICEDWFDK